MAYHKLEEKQMRYRDEEAYERRGGWGIALNDAAGPCLSLFGPFDPEKLIWIISPPIQQSGQFSSVVTILSRENSVFYSSYGTVATAGSITYYVVINY